MNTRMEEGVKESKGEPLLLIDSPLPSACGSQDWAQGQSQELKPQSGSPIWGTRIQLFENNHGDTKSRRDFTGLDW